MLRFGSTLPFEVYTLVGRRNARDGLSQGRPAVAPLAVASGVALGFTPMENDQLRRDRRQICRHFQSQRRLHHA